MNPQTSRTILIGMVLGVILGGIGGYLIPDVMLAFSVIGRLFLHALQIILLPLIISTIIVGTSGLGSTQKVGRATVSALVYFFGTTLVAAAIGLILTFIIRPGLGTSTAGAFIPDMVTMARNMTFLDVFSGMIPNSLVESVGSGIYLGPIILALFIGAVFTTLGRSSAVVVDFFRVIADAVGRLVGLIMYAAPLGLFALVGSAVARNPEALGSIAGNLSWLTVTFVAAILIQGVVVLPMLLKFFGHKPVLSFAGKTAPALINALGTASSTATLPVTYANVVDDNKIDSRAGSLVLPLGTMMNLNGTAIYLTVAAIFVAQMFALPLSILQIITIAALALLLSVGSAGVPGTAPFALAILFATMGYPVEAYGAIGLLVVVDWLFDRGRAVLNVWGDAVGAAVVSETFEFKTAKLAPGATEGSPRTSRSTTTSSRTPSRSRTTSTRSSTSRSSTERKPRATTTKTRERKPARPTTPRTQSERPTESRRPARDAISRRDSRPEHTPDPRHEAPVRPEPLKPPPLPGSRPTAAGDKTEQPAERQTSRRPDTRRHSRPDSRPEARPQRGPDARPPVRPEPRPEPRPAPRPEPKPATEPVASEQETMAEQRGLIAAEIAMLRHDVTSPPATVPDAPEKPTEDRAVEQAQPESAPRPRPARPSTRQPRREPRPAPKPPEAPRAAEPKPPVEKPEPSTPQPEVVKTEKPRLRELPSERADSPEPPSPPIERPKESAPAPAEKAEQSPPERPAPTPVKEPEPVAAASDSAEPAVSYGRSHTRRGPARPESSGTAPAAVETKEKPAEEPVKAEKLTYGRKRRKRTR